MEQLAKFSDTLKHDTGYEPCMLVDNDAYLKANSFIHAHKNAKIMDISHNPVYIRVQLPDNPENKVLSHYNVITVKYDTDN